MDGRQSAVALLAALIMVPRIGLAHPAEPARPVDPARYSGRWFEIARFPNLFERGPDCSAPTADFDTSADGGLKVVQVCRKGSPSGAPRTYRATGRILDPGVNTRLRLTYFVVVSREYWVMDHADDYGWAIVGDPKGKYLWVLARAAEMSATARAEAIQRVRSLGYDPAKLEFPLH